MEMDDDDDEEDAEEEEDVRSLKSPKVAKVVPVSDELPSFLFFHQYSNYKTQQGKRKAWKLP